jgi:hypothetical protein
MNKKAKNDKPRKKPNADIKRFLDKELKHNDFSDQVGFNFYDTIFENHYCDKQLIESLSKKATEMSIYKTIKNNEHFQRHTDKLIKRMTQDILVAVKELKKETERNKIWKEKERIENEKKYEKIKRENAEKAIFAASLTSTQKKAIKRLHGIDANK